MTHLLSRLFIMFVAFTVLFSSIPFTAMVQANDRTLSFDERIGLDDPENELRIQMSDADAEQVISNFTQDIQSKEPVEIIEERTEVSKLFDNMDGTITEEFFLEPVHVQEDDDLVDISSVLVPSEDDESVITTEQTIIDVEFPLEVNDNVVTVKQEDHFLSYEWIEAEGEEGIQQAEIPEVEYEENFLYHRGVFPGIDVRNVLFNTSLKEDIVICEPTSLSTFRVQVNTNLHGQVEKDGSVTWSSGEEVIFTTPTPFMTDSNIDELSGEPNISYDVKFELEENQEGYLLTLSADSDWLNDDERVYPVYIDPTTNVGTSADTFVTSAYPTTTNDKFWESSSGYYSLKVGYYDASSGTNFSFVRQDLSHLKGVAISSATFKIYTAHSYYGTTANGVWLDSVNENWSAATATWNNKPSSSNITSTNVHRGQWAEFDVTSTVQSWVDGKKDNYGFKLHTNGNGQTHWKKFYASENSTSKPVLSVTYTLPTPAKPTVTGVNTNDGTDTGYFNLSWSAISGAKSYIVYIYNGNEYEGINVGNVTSWTTRGKKLWPTDEQLFNGRYWLNWDGKGQELPVDPSDTYQVSGGNYPTDTNYRFRIAAVYEVGTSSMSGTTMPYLPLSKPKRPVGAASVNLDDQSGYVHATWEEVQGATGYKILLYNGTAYEQVADLKVDPKKPNQALQWNSQNKKLWPTATDIANGRYNLRLDGTGTELAKDPSPVYKNSGGSYTTNKNYLIRVKAYNNKHPDSANSDAFSPTIPDLRGPFLGSEPYWPQFTTKVGTINAINGNLSFSETDETFSGRGPSILISRTYNSLAQSKGSFGTGWLFSYDIQVNEQTNGDVILREEDGTEHYYKKSGTTYIPPHGLYLKLEKIDTQFVLTTKSQDKWYFSNGRLVKIEDGTRKENLVTFTYPTNQTVITDASGRKITVNYSNQKISTISDYTNRTWVYSYTGDLLTDVTYPDGQTKTYQYNNGQLTETWDFKQKKTTITYDTQKRFKSVIDPIGKTTTVSYGTNQATITHPATPNDGGTSVASSDVIRYSIAGNPTELITDNGTGKFNLKTTYQYNLHEMVSTKDPRANKEGRPSEQAIYDGNGNVIEYIGANGEQEVAIYNKNDDIVSYTDALGETYETAYDGVLEVSTNDPAKTSTMTIYDDFGNVTHSTKELSVAYNLLTNGGFEKDSTTYSGWTVRRGNGDEGTVSLNTTHKKQERSIRLSHKPSATRDKTKLSYISVTQDIDVEENTLYTLSGLIKTENLNGRAFFNIYQMNGTSGVSAPWIDNRYNYLSGTNDWTERQLSFKTKPGVNRIRVYLEIDDEANGSTGGAAYFDNIQLEHGQVSSSYNPVQNSGLENITPNQGSNFESWTRASGTMKGAINDEVVFDGDISLKVVRKMSTDPNFLYYQRIPVNQTTAQPLSVSAMSFAEEVSNSTTTKPNNGYSVRIVPFNDAGEAMTSAYGRFALGTHEWQKAVATVNPAQPIKEVSIQLRFDGDNIGTFWFDSVRLQEGRIINRATYDSLSNYQTKSTDPAGNATNYQYDTRGNQTKITDPKGQATDYTYDLNNQLKTVTLPVYDVKVHYEYDENGNAAEKRVGSKTDENKIYTRTTYLYDDAQQLKEQRWHTGVKQLITGYTYNARGDLHSTTYPSGNKVTTLYDSADRPTGVTHQKNGEPSEKIYEFTLDENGNQTKVRDFLTNTERVQTYDDGNRMKTQVLGDKTVEWLYDKNDNLTQELIKQGTTSYKHEYQYNTLNYNTEVKDPGNGVYRFQYDEGGNVKTYAAPNETGATFMYNERDLVSSITIGHNEINDLARFSYVYDANGNRTEQTHLQKFANRTDLKGTTTFTYDALNQLTSETVPYTNETIVYTYDPRGNRTKTVISKNGTTLKTINHSFNDLNQLTDIQDGTTLTKWNYDENGNLLDDGRFLYEWDADNRLRFVKTKGTNATVAQYWYDEADRRIRKDVGGTVTNYVYDGDSLNVLYETNAAGQITAYHTYNTNGQLLARTEGSTRYYYHYNAHGDVIMVTKAGATTKETLIVASYVYDAWGNIVYKEGPYADKNPYRYAGYQFDAETNHYYLMARYYNPKSGVFMSMDPDPGDDDDIVTQNGYTYGNNNPVMVVDPDGHYVWLAVNAGFAAYDGYKAYKAGKKAGKKGAHLWGGVAYAAGSNFLKFGHIKKVSKVVGFAKKAEKSKKPKAQTGSYTIYFQNGMKYHGKGPKTRSKVSAKTKANNNKTQVRKIHWTPAKNDREAFKSEHRRIMRDGGPGIRYGNYNKIHSPGRKY